MNKNFQLTLASTSQIRADLLRNAGVPVTVIPARIDEEAIKASLIAEQTPPRDIADALAEMKALKVSRKHPEQLVLGCDQVLETSEGNLLSKPESKEMLMAHLSVLRDSTHKLHSAAVVLDAGQPIWRHVGTATLTMRALSESFLSDYVDRNWPDLQDCVGGYKLEEEGVRLFVDIRGNYFNVLGLPLLPLLNWLTLRGDLPS